MLDIFPQFKKEKKVNIYVELDDWNNPIKFIAKDVESGRKWRVRPKESKQFGMIFRIKHVTYMLNCWDIPTREVNSWFIREVLKEGKKL